MKYNKTQLAYIIIGVVMLLAFSISGARGYRMASVMGSNTWTHSDPGLNHK